MSVCLFACVSRIELEFTYTFSAAKHKYKWVLICQTFIVKSLCHMFPFPEVSMSVMNSSVTIHRLIIGGLCEIDVE